MRDTLSHHGPTHHIDRQAFHMDLVGDSVGDNWASIGSGEDIYLSLEAIKLRKDTTVLLENRKCLFPIRIAMSSVLLGCIFHSDLPHTIITAHKTIWDIVYSNTYKRPIVSGMFMDKAYITVGERTVALKIIARCSITQTPTGQSRVWRRHARKMVLVYFKRI